MFGILAVATTSLYLLYLVGRSIYRLTLHPLASFPGPKIAAVTTLYEWYWDVYLEGKLTEHMVKLHEQYGPLLRITPDEIHINDSSVFDDLYARGTAEAARRHKSPRLSNRFGNRTDCFSTWPHELHKMRRGSINPFFSAKRIIEFQNVIRDKMTKLAKVLVKDSGSDTIVPMERAFMALTGDITTQYAFARAYDQLDSPNFVNTYHDCLRGHFKFSNAAIHLPGIFAIFDRFPRWLTAIVNKPILPVVDFYNESRQQITQVRNGMNEGYKLTTNPTIFHEMLTTNLLPEHEKGDIRLGDEAVEIIAAGLITTSWAMAVGTFHILSNPDILSKLRAELYQHMPNSLNLQNLESNKDVLDWQKLEQLPYLRGCLKEAIRLSGGVVSRAPRILPEEDFKYGKYVIPRGYEVSMTSWYVATDPNIFPEPKRFEPQRWITADGKKNVDMEKWMVAFGKGPRQCAGINLAYAELYTCFAVLFRMFDLELHETTVRDATWIHSYFVPISADDSKGVRVKVRAVRE